MKIKRALGDINYESMMKMDNPEHFHLLTREILTELFAGAGCTKLHFSGANGHLIMLAAIGKA